MSATTPEPVPSEPAAPRRHPAPWGLGVFVVACVVFGYRLGTEPHFVDESAYIAQSYYADLFLEGRRDDPAWLDRAAFDLPPLAKYLVGVALRVAGYPRPAPTAAAAWYENTEFRVGRAGMLLAARVPMVVLGAIGCAAIYAIGARAFGRAGGIVAALLLMASPLYWLHARRAMSDIPAESCGLVALAIGLWAWSRWLSGRGGWRAATAMVVGAGIFAGLSVLAKLNGTIAGMVLGGWAALGLVVGRSSTRSRIGLGLATIAAGIVAFGTFAALNPFLTAQPRPPMAPGVEWLAAKSFWERVRFAKDYRVGASTDSLQQFPHDALPTVPDKLAAVTVQGFGRFSPLGPRHSNSRIRFDWEQDWGAVLWLPLVAVGAVSAWLRGREQRRRGEPPTSWAVLMMAAVALVAVAMFIPLAWDRYFLPIQPGAVLLASAALTWPFARRAEREAA